MALYPRKHSVGAAGLEPAFLVRFGSTPSPTWANTCLCWSRAIWCCPLLSVRDRGCPWRCGPNVDQNAAHARKGVERAQPWLHVPQLLCPLPAETADQADHRRHRPWSATGCRGRRGRPNADQAQWLADQQWGRRRRRPRPRFSRTPGTRGPI